MISLNRVIVAGNLTRDPELKTTTSNRKFTNMSIAINDFWKDKNGKLTKKTNFINIIAWGNLAENCVKFLQKGNAVMIEGRIETDQYNDKQGKKQYITRINTTNVVFLENSNHNNNEENIEDIEEIEEDDDTNLCEVVKPSKTKYSASKKPVRHQVKESSNAYAY